MATPSATWNSTSTSIMVNVTSTGGYKYFKFSLYYNGQEIASSNGYTTSISHYFSGLSPNTSYVVYVGYSTNTSMQAGNPIILYPKTEASTPPTPTLTTPTCSYNSQNPTSLTINLTSTGGYTYFKFSLYVSNTNQKVYEDTYYGTNISKYFSGLTPGVTYAAYISYSTNTTSGSVLGPIYVQTQAVVPPSFLSTSCTSSTVVINISPGGYSYFKYTLYDSYGTQISTTGSTVYTSGSFYGLKSASNYTIKVEYSYDSLSWSTLGSYSVSTDRKIPILNVTVTGTTINASITDKGDYYYFTFSLEDSNGQQIEGHGQLSTSTNQFYTNKPVGSYVVKCNYYNYNQQYGGQLSASAIIQFSTPTIELTASEKKITATITNGGGYTYFKFALYDGDGENLIAGDNAYSTSKIREYSNLAHNTRYVVRCSYSIDGIVANGMLSDAITTPLVTPALSTSSTSKTITVEINDSGGYTYFQFDLYDSTGTQIIQGALSTTKKKDFTGLTHNTSYIVKCYYSTNSYSSQGPIQSTVKTLKLTVVPWDWHSSNGNATALHTSTAHSAITNKGDMSNFSYIVWNDMCNKVYNTIEAANNGYPNWDVTILSYNDTLMSSVDKTLTAKRFNSLKNNIKSVGIVDVNTGDIVYGSYFITMMTQLNNWISTEINK